MAGETPAPASEPVPSADAAPAPLPPPVADPAEERRLQYPPGWRQRRALKVTIVFAALWLMLVLFVRSGTPALAYLVLLSPIYGLTLLIALRTPRALRAARAKKAIGDRLSFGNRLTIAVIVFVGLYIPFAFFSNEVIPLAPLVEFAVMISLTALLYWLAGRSVGVAPSVEALPPASHRLHKQVILPLDDPHYQQTLFLNFDFVDKGRGAKALSKRLDAALENFGVAADRRHGIVEDLEDYHEGFHFGFALTRGARQRRRAGKERRSQVLRTVYTKFNEALEQTA